jgi:hypothetical protein
MATRSETFANIAAGVLCLVVTYAVADRYILPKSSGVAPTNGYRAGDSLTVTPEEVGLAQSRLSAVVVVSTSCHFCAESAEFYRQLTDLQKTYPADKFQTVFLGISGAEDAQAFVAAHKLQTRAARATPADVRPRIPGTPTLLLVESNGRVASSWVGKLSAADEKIVLSTVTQRLQSF